MKTQSPGKLSRRKKMFDHIESCETSGKSQNKYCRDNDLSMGTFTYWLKQYRAIPETQEHSSFIPLTVSETENSDRRFELDLPGGVSLRVYY
ncbi:hypothetical protein KAJ27_00515 [bacterium]|nr:hypothetical protein [Candidatus Neomarinimicrobiota bacterium]MCK5682562.1 hypothetical protein [bacterium]